MIKKKFKPQVTWLFLFIVMLLLAACNSTQSVEPSVSNIKSTVTVDKAVETEEAETLVEQVAEEISEPEGDTEEDSGPVAESEQVRENAPTTTEPEEPASSEPEKPASSELVEPAPELVTEIPPTAAPQSVTEDGVFLVDDRPDNLRAVTEDWDTDWERHTIDYEEFLAGGPSRDGIPSLDNPSFVSIEEATELIGGIEPVIALEIDGDARAYPLQILIWHEIVNDTVGEVPVIVTFCPLCNSALVFDRRLNGETFEFGTSGLLRNSDLVMYDRTTESLWQQFTGEGIVGELAGGQLEFLPSSLVSFIDFQEAFPEGVVLSTATGYDRPYGVNPYSGYDTYEHPLSQDGEISLLKEDQDKRLPAAERVVTLSIAEGGIDVAYPLSVLSEEGAINDRRGEQDIVVLFKSGTTSALGSQLIVLGEDVGATGVFDPTLEGQKLTFSNDGEMITDNETGSS